MSTFKYLPPEDKKIYMIATLGAGALGFGMAADALPVLGMVLSPLAVICGLGFVAAFVGPSEKLFPLRTLPRRAAPGLWAWAVYIVKAILFFAVPAAVLYFVFRLVGLR